MGNQGPTTRRWTREFASAARFLLAAVLANSALAHHLLAESETCPTCQQAGQQDVGSKQWRSEALHESLQQQFKALGKLLASPAQIDQQHLTAVADRQYIGTSLVPRDLAVAAQDCAFTVLRGTEISTATLDRRTLAGLQQSLIELIEPLADAKNIRYKFKTFRIAEQPETQQATTTTYLELQGDNANTGVEIHATWRCRWKLPPEDQREQPPRLLEIRLADYEQVAAPAGPLLADCTSAVLAHNPTFDTQIRRGTNYWMKCLDYRAGVDMQGHQGLAVGDINGDGLDDVYLCQNGALPNQLFIQNRDGTASEQAASAKLDLLTASRGALLLDLDNDGDQDLVLSSDDTVFFLENDGQGRFQMRTGWKSPARLFTLSAADYDQDGDVDIYACGLVDLGERPAPIPYHDANNGGSNALLANEGSWQFRDVTNEVGLDQNNSRFSYASSWEDYDNDGDQDLYVANDFGRNNLYRNDGGRFVDVAAEAGVEDIGAGMSATWGDFNADGYVDLYVSNMFSSAGGRIAFQQQFGGDYGAAGKSHLQRHARGNTLLVNRGDGTFEDISEVAHVTM
ncbi:MAG: FG-GAP repeat domain-containing protein, partial [Bythopirellula sp.]